MEQVEGSSRSTIQLFEKPPLLPMLGVRRKSRESVARVFFGLILPAD
jgi:hypothetical protein